MRMALKLKRCRCRWRAIVFNLVIMDRNGNIEAMLADTPQLRVVADDVFYFQDPARLEPNRWIAVYLANT